jgi:enoyl-CoA hydratase
MIELEDRGNVTILRMARGKANALDLEFVAALTQALDDLEKGPARAVVMTGRGSIFGAGVDLRALVAGGPDYVAKFVPVM